MEDSQHNISESLSEMSMFFLLVCSAQDSEWSAVSYSIWMRFLGMLRDSLLVRENGSTSELEEKRVY